MKIVICPDSFKGSLSAASAARAIQKGFRPIFPGAHYLLQPVADGGEGTLDILAPALGAKAFTARVPDPLSRPVSARAAITPDGTGIMEMAAASGLPLLKPHEYNPALTHTAGSGALIRALLERGARKILVGVGGSATVDGGMGLARELGARFLDRRGVEITDGGGSLGKIERVDLSKLDPRLKRVEIIVLCDVNNPLTGPRGAARVYGPQKGAGPRQVAELEAGLAHFAEKTARATGQDVAGLPGAGAAGGLAAGLAAFLGARLRPGIDVILEETGFEHKLAGASLALTGEGRIDDQAGFGKALLGVARVAGKNRVPLVAFCGCREGNLSALRRAGLCAVFNILPCPLSLEEALADGAKNLAATAAEVARLLSLASRPGAI